MATIKEVAKLAGVSITTVSRALNHRGYISSEMYAKIDKAMNELNYHPNEVARSLTRRSTKIIGVLVPMVDNPFFAEVVSELSKALSQQGYKMMLYTAMSNDDRAAEYINMLKANQVDGIIICLRGRAIEAELSDNLPAVSFERLKVGHLPTVLCDNEAGGRLAARTLIASGCRRPVMLGSFHDKSIPAYSRLKGFLAELQAHHLEERYVEIYDRGVDEVYSQFSRAVLEKYPDADGFFCSSDVMAAQLIHTLHDAGKSVPRDVQVIGFNGNRFGQELTPALTSIRQPVPDMCEAAVSCLIKQIQGESVPLDTVLPVTLIRRESTRAIEGGHEHDA